MQKTSAKSTANNAAPTIVAPPASAAAPVEKKLRGRPKGAIREAFFSVAALVNGELVHELVQVTRGEKITPEEMGAEARKIFLKKHKTDVESEIGPIFKASLMQTSTNKRQSIRMSEADINYTGRKIQAEYHGWQVIGRYIQDETGAESKENVRVFFQKDLQTDKKRAKPQPAIKAISDLTNISDLPSATTHA
jgi:hypothetical protein